MKKLLVALIAFAIFAGVGLLTANQLGNNAFRLAESEVDLCYAERGYLPGTARSVPPETIAECTRAIRTYEDGVMMRFVYGGLVGLAVAGLFFLVAWFLFLRRRSAGGVPPPAG